MVLTRCQENKILVHVLSVGLAEPYDGTGMIEFVLKHNSLCSLVDISDISAADIQGFFRLDANNVETTVPLILGDRKKLKRLQALIKITIWDNKDTIPDYADWIQVT